MLTEVIFHGLADLPPGSLRYFVLFLGRDETVLDVFSHVFLNYRHPFPHPQSVQISDHNFSKILNFRSWIKKKELKLYLYYVKNIHLTSFSKQFFRPPPSPSLSLFIVREQKPITENWKQSVSQSLSQCNNTHHHEFPASWCSKTET